MGPKFDAWLRRVDNALMRLCGIGTADLVDCCYADWYDEGLSPSEAARRALRENGF
jgi:hypothetical protein